MQTRSFPRIVAVASLLLSHAFAGEGWLVDFEKAKLTAKTESKDILMDFTGSDWCGWCIKKKQTEAVKKQNEDLQKRYGVEGYPTFVLVDGEGKELGRHVGYLKGGPSAFVQKIEGWTKSKSAK